MAMELKRIKITLAREVEQIIPANNWWSVYEVHGNDGVKELELSRLVCWGIIRKGNDKWVVGFDTDESGVDECETVENFLFYIYAEDEETAKKKAIEKYEIDYEKKAGAVVVP